MTCVYASMSDWSCKTPVWIFERYEFDARLFDFGSSISSLNQRKDERFSINSSNLEIKIQQGWKAIYTFDYLIWTNHGSLIQQIAVEKEKVNVAWLNENENDFCPINVQLKTNTSSKIHVRLCLENS